MFVYQKKLQYPVRIKNTNPKLAAQIISQYGGPECGRVRTPPSADLDTESANVDTAPLLLR